MQRWSDSIIKPLKKGLFGDENYAGPDSSLRPGDALPLAGICRDLVAVPEEAWAGYAFSREPLNGRVGDELRAELMERSIACGREWAERMRERFGTSSPERIAEGLGAKLDFPERPQSLSRVLFAEFVEPDVIHVFGDGLVKAREAMADPAVRDALGERLNVRQLLIAHEAFHLVELQNKGQVWTEEYRLDLWGRFPIKNRARLVVLSEIAAMAFARELLGLPYSPYVLDVVLTYAYSPEAGTSLYKDALSYLPAGTLPEAGACEADSPKTEPAETETAKTEPAKADSTHES